jgi:hypothetical protein
MPERKTSITWPMVGLVVACAGFLLGVLWVIPKDDTQSRAALIGILVTASGASVAYFTRSKVNDVVDEVGAVRTQVNGRMTQLLKQNADQAEALRQAAAELAAYRVLLGGGQLPPLTSIPVPRETEGGEHGRDDQSG